MPLTQADYVSAFSKALIMFVMIVYHQRYSSGGGETSDPDAPTTSFSEDLSAFVAKFPPEAFGALAGVIVVVMYSKFGLSKAAAEARAKAD